MCVPSVHFHIINLFHIKLVGNFSYLKLHQLFFMKMEIISQDCHINFSPFHKVPAGNMAWQKIWPSVYLGNYLSTLPHECGTSHLYLFSNDALRNCMFTSLFNWRSWEIIHFSMLRYKNSSNVGKDFYENLGSHGVEYKDGFFWDITLCSQAKVYRRSQMFLPSPSSGRHRRQWKLLKRR